MFGMIFILKRRYSDLGKVNDKHEMRNSKQLDTLSDYDKVMFFSVKWKIADLFSNCYCQLFLSLE